VHAVEVFAKRFEGFEVAALDLPAKYNNDGLIGMNLLNQFDWCMHLKQQIISIKE
jgi:predicted aspartyl protease